MHIKRYILLLFVLTCVKVSWAQTITPQVINAAGGDRTHVSGVSLIDNVGEPFTQSIGSNDNVTQGFIQNFTVTGNFVLSWVKNNVSCFGKKDGNISTALTQPYPIDSIRYFWSPDSVCPSHTCGSIDSLAPGTYSYLAIIYNSVKNDTIASGPIVIADGSGPCLVEVYTGITANGDNINDWFIVKNIDEFKDNRVSIYNRWGTLLFDAYNYDNVKIYWPKSENLSTLVAGTYFYIIELGDGSKPLKGWVELFK